MFQYTQIGIQFDAPTTSLWQSENICKRACFYASRPDQCVCLDFFPRLETHKGRSYLFDRFSQTDFNSSLLSSSLAYLRKLSLNCASISFPISIMITRAI